MIKYTVKIEPDGDYCGKCKYRVFMETYTLCPNVTCGLFRKLLERTVAGRRLVRCNACSRLDKAQQEFGE